MLVSAVKELSMERDERGRFTESNRELDRERDARGRFVKGSAVKKLGLRLTKERLKKLEAIASLEKKTIHEVAGEILNNYLDEYEIPKN